MRLFVRRARTHYTDGARERRRGPSPPPIVRAAPSSLSRDPSTRRSHLADRIDAAAAGRRKFSHPDVRRP